MSQSGPQSALLPDGRLHLHHGPIDLIIESYGPGRNASYATATHKFATILDELVGELPALRRPVTMAPSPSDMHSGAIAVAMATAVRPFAPQFITPMAAVAGAVADAVLAVIAATPKIIKAYVNNGGDIALYLTEGQRFQAAIFADSPGAFALYDTDSARGVATSGWRGRSHSLGIADAVTVLAANAAAADAAATMIANAVDLPNHPAITRTPACDLAPDSDLGRRLVTVSVGALSTNETAAALAQGRYYGERLLARGLISAAALQLDGQVQFVGADGFRPLSAKPKSAIIKGHDEQAQ